jgi:hypothetical protein
MIIRERSWESNHKVKANRERTIKVQIDTHFLVLSLAVHVRFLVLADEPQVLNIARVAIRKTTSPKHHVYERKR